MKLLGAINNSCDMLSPRESWEDLSARVPMLLIPMGIVAHAGSIDFIKSGIIRNLDWEAQMPPWFSRELHRSLCGLE